MAEVGGRVEGRTGLTRSKEGAREFSDNVTSLFLQ